MACNEGGDAKACSMLTAATKRLASKISSVFTKAAAVAVEPGPPPRAYDEKAWVNALAGPAPGGFNDIWNTALRCVRRGSATRADTLQNHVPSVIGTERGAQCL